MASRDAEAYVILVMALAVGVLGALDVADAGTVAAATLAVLGLILFDLLAGRKLLRRVDHDIRGLADAIRSAEAPDSVDRVLKESTPGAMLDLEGAAEVWLVGITLNRTIRSYLPSLQGVLAAGGTVRIALVDPDGAGPGEAARRTGLPERLRVFEHRVQPSIDLLRYLARVGAHRLEVRLLPFAPVFGMVVVDAGKATSRIAVDVYSHRPDGHEAAVVVHAGRDPSWYQYFRREYEHIWETGQVVDLASTR